MNAARFQPCRVVDDAHVPCLRCPAWCMTRGFKHYSRLLLQSLDHAGTRAVGRDGCELEARTQHLLAHVDLLHHLHARR